MSRAPAKPIVVIKKVIAKAINSLLPRISDLYCFLFSKKYFSGYHSLLLTLSARCLGVGNYKTPYESGEEIFAAEFLKRFDSERNVVVDVGANKGQFATSILKRTSNIHVVSLEPNPNAYSELQKNTEIFRCRHRCLMIGVSNQEEILNLYDYLGMEGSSHSSLYSEALLRTSRTGKKLSKTRVKLMPLDLISDEIKQRICILKIDIEGHEKKALEGCQKLISSNKKPYCILIEFNEMNLYSLSNMYTIENVVGKNYKLFRILPGGKLLPLSRENHLLRELYGYQNLVFILNDWVD